MAKVAFLGLGVMGFPMAGHLKNKGGHEVTVYNRTAAKAEAWVKQYGGKSASTPKAAAEGQDFVMCCVGNDNDLREVTLGANGAFAGVGKGKVFVDHTTASAEVARELYAAARQGGFDFIDAPVSGTKKPAEDGSLVILAAGPQDQVKALEPVFLAMGKKVVYCGAAGQGSMMKMFINLLLGIMMEGFAEALNFGRLGGLDLDAMLETAFSGAMNSPMFQVKAPLIKENRYPAAFPLKHLAKDCKFVVDTAFELGAPVPVGQVLLQLYRLGWAQGWGDEDISAIAKVLEHLNPKA